jgi:hypothetical protein
MVGLATETDVERLRQMALLLAAENARLHRRLVELTRALADAKGAAGQAQLELEIARLQEQLAARTRALFGPSSERRGGPPADDAPAPAPRRGHGPRAQPAAPAGRRRAHARGGRGAVSAVWRRADPVARPV